MQESYVEGLATHDAPESCLDYPQGSGEALTGERTGGLLSSEISQIQMSTRLGAGEDNISITAKRKVMQDLAESVNLACAEAFYAKIGIPGKLPRRRQAIGGWYQ